MEVYSNIDLPNSIYNEILEISKGKDTISKHLKNYSTINKTFLTKIIIDDDFDEKMLHFAKVALKNGCYFDNFKSLDIFHHGFIGHVGFDSTLVGVFSIRPISKHLIEFLEYAHEIKYNLDYKIDLSTALCWTSQLDFLKRIHKIGFCMEDDMLLTCVLGLCYENKKKYDDRLNIIKWGIKNKIPKYEKYINYTDYESISGITSYENPECTLFILDKDNNYIDSNNVPDEKVNNLMQMYKEDKLKPDLFELYIIKYAK